MLSRFKATARSFDWAEEPWCTLLNEPQQYGLKLGKVELKLTRSSKANPLGSPHLLFQAFMIIISLKCSEHLKDFYLFITKNNNRLLCPMMQQMSYLVGKVPRQQQKKLHWISLPCFPPSLPAGLKGSLLSSIPP